MRHLSVWRLLLDGRVLDALSTNLIAYNAAAFFLVVPTGTIYDNPTLSVTRRRYVGDGMREELVVHNAGTHTVSAQPTVAFGADFADIFEVKDNGSKAGRVVVTSSGDAAVVDYRRGDFSRQTTIHADGALVAEGSLTFPIPAATGAVLARKDRGHGR